MRTIPQPSPQGPIGARTNLKARMYPNGETVVYKARGYKPEPMPRPHQYDEAGLFCACMRAYGTLAPALMAGLVPLGSSPLTNSDKKTGNEAEPNEDAPSSLKRYGRNGITTYGARRVRNACYLIEQSVPKMCTVFATCTVPALPFEEMRLIHERWADVVEAYRRKLRRRLQEKGLSGKSVTVSEVQGKRYERTGIPVLHIHTVFAGRCRDGSPALTPKDHDHIWLSSLQVVLPKFPLKVGSACNLQWVKKSAEGYLGKYMTKGTKAVRGMCDAGFEGWLPKQWWSMSRALGEEIDHETRSIDELAEWLNDVADIEGTDIWLWHRDVSIEMRSGDSIIIARYGRLSTGQVAQIKAAYPKPSGVDGESPPFV